jgi:hypothetical protein
MPLETQVMYSKAALDITCRPYLVGEKLGQLAKTASEDFFRYVIALIFHIGASRSSLACWRCDVDHITASQVWLTYHGVTLMAVQRN